MKTEKVEVIAENAYLYSTWKDGKLNCYSGYVKEYKCFDDYNGDILRPTYWRFIVDEKFISERQRTSYNCDREEGVIFNKVVWFRERDDEKAKTIFIEYERHQIEQLRAKIEQHERIIELLEN